MTRVTHNLKEPWDMELRAYEKLVNIWQIKPENFSKDIDVLREKVNTQYKKAKRAVIAITTNGLLAILFLMLGIEIAAILGTVIIITLIVTQGKLIYSFLKISKYFTTRPFLNYTSIFEVTCCYLYDMWDFDVWIPHSH